MAKAKQKTRRHSPATAVAADGSHGRLSRVTHGVGSLLKTAGAAAGTLVGRVPGTVRATRTGAQGTTSALQSLPDATLRWMAAGSVGLGAGDA